MPPDPTILILAGGRSTRMTAPKHLLPCPSLYASPPGAELPAYLHLLRTAREALSLASLSSRGAGSGAEGGGGGGDGAERGRGDGHAALLSLRARGDEAGLAGFGEEWTGIFDDDADGELFPAPSLYPLPAAYASHTRADGAEPATDPVQRPEKVNTTEKVNKDRDIGPALGLLHAHTLHPTSTLLVIATDYLLLEAHDIARLLLRPASSLPTSSPAVALAAANEADEADPPRTQPAITVFRNASGYLEPLVGLWTPEALGELKGAVRRGRTGPVGVVRGLVEAGRGCVVPWDEGGGSVDGGREIGAGGGTGMTRLDNINTPAEWAAALAALRARAAVSATASVAHT